MVQRKKKVAKKDDIKLKRLSSGFSYFHGVKTSLFDSKNSFLKLWFSEHEVCKHLAIIFSSLH